jgi:catechol 2,3-dioxygenase-like lactoylglutathione lyase family enzyme
MKASPKLDQPLVRKVNAVVLETGRLQEMVCFYRALGVPLVEEQHGDGPLHYACELAGAHVAIYESPAGEAPRHDHGGATMVGFDVDSLELALDLLKACHAKVLKGPEKVSWGRRAIVLDPDGRAVELNEG